MTSLARDETPRTGNRPAAFSLSRWFTTVGLLSIVLLAVIGALLLSRLFEERMLSQEGRLTMQFVQGIIDVEGAASYFERPQADHESYMEQLLAHIARSPDVLRTNLYSRDRRVIWSSDPSLTGRSFAGEANPELDAALAGELEIHEEQADEEHHEKAEHSNLPAGDDYFIELYVPVWDSARKNVVGAVELYRAAKLLRETIASGMRLIWAGALGAAAVLYVALLPLVRRADAMIRDQQDRIVEAQTLAAIGDLGIGRCPRHPQSARRDPHLGRDRKGRVRRWARPRGRRRHHGPGRPARALGSGAADLRAPAGRGAPARWPRDGRARQPRTVCRGHAPPRYRGWRRVWQASFRRCAATRS